MYGDMNLVTFPAARNEVTGLPHGKILNRLHRPTKRLLNRFDRDLRARVEQRGPLLKGQVPRIGRLLGNR